MKRLAIILHDKTAPQGFITSILARHTIQPTIIDITTDALPDPTDYGAIIALGGTQHVYEMDHDPYFTSEKIWLQRIVQADIPYLGICLGGQLLAAALGGQVRLHSRAEIGFFEVPLTNEGQQDPLFQGLPTHPKVFHWHEDTFDLPAQAVLLATNSDTINQAFRYGRRAYGLQFHIEVDQTIFHDWLYQSSLDPNILQASGLSTHRPTLEKEWRDQLPIYQKHTTILLENFLALSHLIA